MENTNQEKLKIISKCPLCGEKTLHTYGNGIMLQCIACGFVSSKGLEGPKEKSALYKSLSPDMKQWAVETEERTWIPTMLTLPTGMIHPVAKGKEMHWAYAPMIDIPEKDREKYPVKGKENEFYKKRYDTENTRYYKHFYQVLRELANSTKEEEPVVKEIKIPKIKDK